ncbi:unnamed protein product [Arctia plantaginis]|uniref:RNase H type-1 domain-containing protein n=1 Tax=Arctia plantaginis TaxID=874455 RepID=A0A8S1AYB1_ARCPL|nr:unnamed protein product [Arctia plantaginis]
MALIPEPYVGNIQRMRDYRGARIFQAPEDGSGIVKAAIAVFDTDLDVTQCPELTTHNTVVSKLTLPWWSNELAALKREVTTRKRRIRCDAPIHREHVVAEYLQFKEDYERKARCAQIQSWKDFCTRQDRQGVWEGINRVIGRTKKREEDVALIKNGVPLSPAESASHLAETFYSEDSHTTDSQHHRDTRDLAQRTILRDPDTFLALANKCLTLGHFPKKWKEATAVVLRKPGKEDYQSAKSYRPIGLLPVLEKVLEKMVVARLQWHLVPRLSTRQYGFMPQRSTEDALYILVNQIKAVIKLKKLVTLVSLDIEGAFDSAWWPAIKVRLAEEGCSVNIRRLLHSYLDDRCVKLRYAGAEHRPETQKGCVQGSISGPILWNILLDPLLKGLQEPGVTCQAFADDVVLLFAEYTALEVQRHGNAALDFVQGWGVKNKLKFAPHKTCDMLLTNKLKHDTPLLASAYAPAVDKLGVRKLLDTVQRGFAQKICKSYRTVSLNLALLLAGLLPLDLRIKKAAALYEARKGSTRLVLGDREVERVVRYAELPHPALRMNLRFQSLEDQSLVDQHNVQSLRIFTDGSKLQGKIGAALSIWDSRAEVWSRKLGELLAIRRASSEILSCSAGSCGIYSDSRAALETVTNPGTLHPLAIQARRNFSEALSQGKDVTLFWIKANAGIDGNERANQLAKEAALSSRRKPDYDLCPVSFVNRQIRSDSLDEWNRRYQSGHEASVTRVFFPDARDAYCLMRKIRPQGVATQILTGHGGFSQYLHRFRCRESPSCICDPAQDEDPAHHI